LKYKRYMSISVFYKRCLLFSKRYLTVWDFLTGVLHANFERVCWVPVFNTMKNSDGVSILDLEASFDSGVGGMQGIQAHPQKF